MKKKLFRKTVVLATALLVLCAWVVPAVTAAPLPGGTLDPTTIEQYVIPLVIPPVINDTNPKNKNQDPYEIAVREFKQQILPGGIWNGLGFTNQTHKATTIWSYGPAADPLPDSSGLPGGALGVAPAPNSQFNYPAYTFETKSNVPVDVRWINDLKENFGAGPGFLEHLLPVDQTLHWANPEEDCRVGDARTDCAGNSADFYLGPVPIVTHVHGAHVDPHSDGYPEAWWLPSGVDLATYTPEGTLFDDAVGNARGGNLGYADYSYRQDQPATTLWYHDHSLGMTRLNVYAGPAGFWLIRGGPFDGAVDDDTGRRAKLPKQAPKPGQSVLELNVPGSTVRNKVREIPIVIQDRSFNDDGTLFYPDNRAFFEFLNVPNEEEQFLGRPDLDIPFVPDIDSDIAPIWNPEAFFNVMVVNGVSWPTLDVAPAIYRFRLLNGCNSRFLWLKFSDPNVKVYQIGADQGFLPAAENMNILDLDDTGDGKAQVLMALAERADVIVDFRGLSDGDTIELLNIGPDEPFGGGLPCPAGENPDDNDGCGDFAAADPETTGRVMQFVVKSALLQPTDAKTTPPEYLVLNSEPALIGPTAATRQVSLNEGESELLCVIEDENDNLVQAFDSDTGEPLSPPDCEDSQEGDIGAVPFGPKEALLGTVDLTGGPGNTPIGIPLKWTDDSGVPKTITLENGGTVTVNVTENPILGDTEDWEIYNFTADAHPIHLHLVRFEVLGREVIGGGTSIVGTNDPLPWEEGFKDTVISYPDEITRIKAKFDIAGLYVWHCHIVEHEDNEMMRPYVVSAAAP